MKALRAISIFVVVGSLVGVCAPDDASFTGAPAILVIIVFSILGAWAHSRIEQ